MPLTLISRACAAVEWELYEGMEFTRMEADDHLLELFNYITQRGSRSGWHAVPVHGMNGSLEPYQTQPSRI